MTKLLSLGAIAYDQRTIQRAVVAFDCTPFRWELLAAMVDRSVSLTDVVEGLGLENRYTEKPLSELGAEHLMMWLIQVGLLRREVDGQGLTNSFRLTPLGRQVVAQWQGDPASIKISLGERWLNNVRCWASRFSV